MEKLLWRNRVKNRWQFIFWYFLFFSRQLAVLCGGIALIISPTGELLQIPLWFLNGTPFNNYIIPGLILFILLGIYPAIVLIGLIVRLNWKIFNYINIYKEQHWSWIGSLYTGIMLIIWIDFQIMLIGYDHYIQFIYALLGVIIVISSLVPSVKTYYLNAQE